MVHSLPGGGGGPVTWVSGCYLGYESVGQIEESHHSTPVDAVGEDARGHLHEDVLSTVGLNLVDQSGRKELRSSVKVF